MRNEQQLGIKRSAVLDGKLMNACMMDSQVPESVRAHLRMLVMLVRSTLQNWKYPSDKQQGAVELMLQQAESLSDSLFDGWPQWLSQ